MSQVRDILEPIPAISIDVGIAEPAAAEGRMAVVTVSIRTRMTMAVLRVRDGVLGARSIIDSFSHTGA